MQSVEGSSKWMLALALSVAVLVGLRNIGQVQSTPYGSLILSAISFAVFIGIGLAAVRDGINSTRAVRWGLVAACAYLVLTSMIRALSPPESPYSNVSYRPIDFVVGILSAFFLVGLPVAIGTSIADQQLRKPKPLPEDPPPPKEPIAPTVIAALLIGLLPLAHIGLYIRGFSGRIDVPIYGILLFTAPIGAVMAVVAVILCACLSKHGAIAMLATFFYGVGAVLIFGALYLVGANFSIPP